ncbi:glycosyltransferase family 39 protein [Candidatus Woesebacteria bacterium]|nr:glycosyltransferase family 39 protein [Candidatus Woesebacteria bacterium]
MSRNISSYCTVLLVVLVSTVIAWLPFMLKAHSWYGIDFFVGSASSNASFLMVYQNYDGPLYIIPAKTLYNKELFEKLPIEQGLSWEYFAAHLPLYPVVISAFAYIMGYLKSMLFTSIFYSVLLGLFFYALIDKLRLTEKPLLLTTVFLFLPRFLVVRSVGAPETMFLFFILSSIYYFEQKNYLIAGFLGGLAAMTKSPGILLAGGYGLAIIEEWIRTKRFNWRWFFLALIPLGLVAVFKLYAIQYGDFFAYFKSGDNIHLVKPFAVFNAGATWVGSWWLEDVIFYFFLYGLALYSLKDHWNRSFFYVPLVFFVSTLFVEHRDIARYSLPMWPFAVIAFQQFFTSKRFAVIAAILLPAIYLYAWNFMLHNTLPISDWSAFL